MAQSAKFMSASVKIRDGRDNFFTPLRLIFALLVMIGHAHVISAGNVDSEPHLFLNYTYSYTAVNMFFVTSGLLVTKSILSRGDMPAFVAARSLRIFPALVMHIIFVTLIVGVAITTLPILEYLSHKDVLMQPIWVLTFFNTDMILPGVFEANAEPFASAPLWTLRFEMLCYIATALAFSLGFLRRKWMALAQFIVPSMLWIIGHSYGLYDALPGSAENLVRFGIAYGLGAAVYAYRDRLTFYWVAIPFLAGLVWITQASAFTEVAMNMMIATIVIWAAYVKVPKLAWMQRETDLSYGIYIYHWVIMQLIISLTPGLPVATLFVLALPITVCLAWLSWTYIEAPMLRYKSRFGDWLRFGRSRRDFDPKAVLLD